jgi:integrating conjugative element protein (TIGR03765 family)
MVTIQSLCRSFKRKIKTRVLRRSIPVLGLLAIFSIPMVSFSALTVVEDQGGDSALPYYKNFSPNAADSSLKHLPPLVQSHDESLVLPIVSQRLSPGVVEPRPVNAGGLIQPVFIVGDDPLSRRWLVEKREDLKALNALGLIVNVETMKALKEIRALGQGLTILPVSGDKIAERLDLDHYPCLIRETSVEP